jgi:Zn-dependent protease with chaperone function
MHSIDIPVSAAFKAQTTKAVLAIVVFLVSYTILFLFAIGLAGICVYAGLAIIVSHPSFLTIVLGLGLGSLGVFVLIFLMKFLFSSKKFDRSHLVEIQRADHPELFGMIDEIVQKVGTNFPKKVYLSSDVNASVFYDSNFWSMFLPIQKNLRIGLGLVNSLTKSELKAVLAHEFGHFSQKSMKVGSYVYHVNQVIFNLLFENEGYENMIEKWGKISDYFSVFNLLAVKIVKGIQWILGKLYGLVNKTYMGLSREMEFHADQIAALVAGSQPMASALMRVSLADSSLNAVYSFYDQKVKDNIVSQNVYQEQSKVMHFLAEKNQVPIEGDFPKVAMGDWNRLNRSRLVIEDQWASHPSTEDRVDEISKIGAKPEPPSNQPANSLFKNVEHLQQQLTLKAFDGLVDLDKRVFLPAEEFWQSYHTDYAMNSYPELFLGYYDHHNPTVIDPDSLPHKEGKQDFESLFGQEILEIAKEKSAMENDIVTLGHAKDGNIEIKTFDYDGKKYQKKDADALIDELRTRIEQATLKLEENDKKIYAHFLAKELGTGEEPKFATYYREYTDYERGYAEKFDVFAQVSNVVQFVNVTTPFEQIQSNFRSMLPLEESLKKEIAWLLDLEVMVKEINPEHRESLNRFATGKWTYFTGSAYQESQLNLLFESMNLYAQYLYRGHFLLKKRLLMKMESLGF